MQSVKKEFHAKYSHRDVDVQDKSTYVYSQVPVGGVCQNYTLDSWLARHQNEERMCCSFYLPMIKSSLTGFRNLITSLLHAMVHVVT